MASEKTLEAYRAGALKKIKRARKRYPDLEHPLDALFTFVENYDGVLTPNSARLWRQELRIAVRELVEADTRDLYPRQKADYLKRMDQTVDALRGRPEEPRTSSKKCKDPSKDEVVQVFTRLKKRAIELDRMRMAATAIYCILMPRIGARSVELVDARVEEGILILPNAKRATEQAKERRLDIGHWDIHYRVALAALIDIVNFEVDEIGYDAWHSVLAETLARACEAVNVRRLSPSSFRHTALSTWSAAGLSMEEIARLAGHFCRRSPQHYIRTASAWGHEDSIVKSPAPTEPTREITEATAASPEPEFDYEPMPTPTPIPTKPNETQKLQTAHRLGFMEWENGLIQNTQRLVRERSSAPVSEQTSGSQIPPRSMKPG